MGGNLFKLGRLPKQQYLEIEQSLMPYLQQKFGEHFRIPRYYGDKADFGDLDIVLSSVAIKSTWQDLKQEIIEDLNISQYQSIRGVLSTVYQNFQVDFFIKEEKYFLSTYHFLCYNDIGNLVGKICRRFNLKYGEKGLAYVFRRADGHYVKDISISLDFQKIYAFLKLDYQQWERGFEDRTAMFEWVMASPYFSVEPYQRLSKTLKKRAKERPTIRHFLNYLEEQQIEKAYTYLEDKTAYLPMIADFFPEANLLEQVKQEQEREKYVLAIRAKYNGKIVMTLLPHLKGKALGEFMQAFQAQFEDVEKAMYEMEAEEIQKMVLDFGRSYRT